MINKLYFLIIVIISSCINKNNFKEIELNLDAESGEPYLLKSNDNLYMSWTELKNDSVFLYEGKLEKDQLVDKNLISKGVDWFVNWADFPSISHNKINDNMISFNLKKSSEATFSYDINYHFKKNDKWINKNKLHNDNTFTEHGFVSIQPFKDGFIASWLDGRNTSHEKSSHNDHGSGPMSLRSAIVSENGEVIEEFEIDSKVCDCCQTSMTVANGTPIVVYRDRTDQEIRDISISRYVDGSWTDPQLINNDGWVINGCPVNGPNIDSYGDNVVVSWFSASNGIPKVNVKFSKDRGYSFSEKIYVNDLNNIPLGRVDVEFIDNDEILISWLSSLDGKGLLLMRKINSKGNLGKITSFENISTQRSTGFPQIEKFKDNIYISWTDSEGETKNIRTFKVPVSAL